jgi:uncharacterized delta-60 repeat protein
MLGFAASTATTTVNGAAEEWRIDEAMRVVIGNGFDTGRLDAVLADGSILVDFGRTRLLADGSIDPGRVAPAATWRDVFASEHGALAVVSMDQGEQHEVFLLDANGEETGRRAVLDGALYDVVFQPDGKAILLGAFRAVDGVFRAGLARLTADGALDSAFDPGTGPDVVAWFGSGWLQADGRLLICGSFSAFGGVPRAQIVRLHADGTLDFSYDPGPAMHGNGSYVSAVAVDSLGRVLRADAPASLDAPGVLRRSDADGANPVVLVEFSSGSVTQIVPTIDDRILVVGDFEGIGGKARRRLARLEENGAVDETFEAGLVRVVPGARTIVMADGRIVVEASDSGVLRLSTDGAIDPTFEPETPARARVTALAETGDGGLVIGGDFTHVDGEPRPMIARIAANGTLDAGFAPQLGVGGRAFDADAPGPVRAVAVQADGAVLVGGAFDTANGVPRVALARWTADGVFDATFDAQFGAGAVVEAIVVQSDGRIVVGGSFASVGGAAQANVCRLLPDGSVDTGFAITSGVTGADARVYAIELLADDALLVAGHFDAWNGVRRWSVARATADGQLDASFDPGSATAGLTIHSVSALTDGRVAIGATSLVAPVWRWGVLETDGEVAFWGEAPQDIGRLEAPIVRTDAEGGVLVAVRRPQPEHLGRHFSTVERARGDGTYNRALAVEFGLGGVEAMRRLADGSIVIAGTFAGADALPFANLARLVPSDLPARPRLANLSTRARVGAGEEVMIAGFSIAGTEKQRVLLRGVGPTLERDHGFVGAASGLELVLFRAGSGVPIADGVAYSVTYPAASGTDGYFGELARRFGAFPLNGFDPRFLPNDVGWVFDLEPGVYTAHLRATTPGIALAEVYDINGIGADRHVVNLSTRARVGGGDEVVIGGFVVDRGTKRLLVRGVGPELAEQGVADPVADPAIRIVRSSDGFVAASNDDWSDDPDAAAIAEAAELAGAFPLPAGSRDAALLVELSVGAYTVVLHSADDAPGIALVEAYELPEP